jgi:hypothetical protein
VLPDGATGSEDLAGDAGLLSSQRRRLAEIFRLLPSMGRGRGVLLVEIHVGEGELLVEIDGEGRGCKLLLQILGEGELKWTGGRLLCSSWLCVRAEERRKGREGGGADSATEEGRGR